MSSLNVVTELIEPLKSAPTVTSARCFYGELIARGDAIRWTGSINIKVRALSRAIFVSKHYPYTELLVGVSVSLRVHVAQSMPVCTFVCSPPAMDTGLIVNINYEVLERIEHTRP